MSSATKGSISKDIKIDIYWRAPKGTVKSEMNKTKYRRNRGRTTIKMMKKLIDSGAIHDVEDHISGKLNAMEKLYPASVVLDPKMRGSGIRTDKWKTEVTYYGGDTKNESYTIRVNCKNMQENTPYEIRTEKVNGKPVKVYRGVMYNLAAMRLAKRSRKIVPRGQKVLLGEISKNISFEAYSDDDYDYSYENYETFEEREQREREEEAEEKLEWIKGERDTLKYMKRDMNLAFHSKILDERSKLVDMNIDIKNKTTDKYIKASQELSDLKYGIDESFRRIDALNKINTFRKLDRQRKRYSRLEQSVGPEMAARINAYEALHPGESIDYSLYAVNPIKKKSTKKRNK